MTSPTPIRILIIQALIIVPACRDADQATTDGGDGDSGTAQCAAGLRAVGPACAPIFDECKDDEIPMLGGGCRHVGPPKTCLKGWAKVKGGWCEPILPKGKCPAGTMEVIGKSTCQPIGDCGNGTWGKIKTTASTIFVDQSYSGNNANGSLARPYTTIGAALEAATAGTHIAVAAGTYKENISIERKVTLEGRCAQKVIIRGGKVYATVEMIKWATGANLRGVTISGYGGGVRVEGVAATVERVSVRGCEGRGIWVESGGTLTLRDSLVTGNRHGGIDVFGSKATVERSVVRDTRERTSDKKFGGGIEANVGAGRKQNQGSELVLRDSLVANNRFIGIIVASSKATVERSVVRDTREQASDKEAGTGIQAFVGIDQSQGSELVLRDSLVAGNRNAGIVVASSKATVERSVVRDTRGRASNKQLGCGILAIDGPNQSRGSELVLRESLVTGNRTEGIYMLGSKVTVERSVVRDTHEQASDNKRGSGIYAALGSGQSRGSELVLRDSLVAGNRTVGIGVASSKASVERSVVRDTREQASDKQFGQGIQASVRPGQSGGSELVLRDSLAAGNRTVGILVLGSKATVERSVVRDTRKNGLGGYGDGLIGGEKSTLQARDSTVESSARAGFLIENSSGSIHRCLIRRNIFAIDLEKGARPTIGTDNMIVDNKENEVTSRNLKIPSPAKFPITP